MRRPLAEYGGRKGGKVRRNEDNILMYMLMEESASDEVKHPHTDLYPRADFMRTERACTRSCRNAQCTPCHCQLRGYLAGSPFRHSRQT